MKSIFANETLKTVYGMPTPQRRAFVRRATGRSKLFTVFCWTMVPLILPFTFIGAALGETLDARSLGGFVGTITGSMVFCLITVTWLTALYKDQLHRERSSIESSDAPQE